MLDDWSHKWSKSLGICVCEIMSCNVDDDYGSDDDDCDDTDNDDNFCDYFIVWGIQMLCLSQEYYICT